MNDDNPFVNRLLNVAKELKKAEYVRSKQTLKAFLIF